MRKIVKALRTNVDGSYEKYLNKPIDNNAILLEAGQGKNNNGNMFALLREIETNDKWSELKPFFVVTNGSENETHEKFAFYGFTRVKCVIRDSKEYKKVLATSKYLVTDNTFPPYFLKRNEQIYLNTWHGTPLKTLGRADIENSASLGNVQKNYFMADYALFPNDYTRKVFDNDYMLKGFTRGKYILLDYPRNEVLTDRLHATDLKKQLGFENKKIIAYMPTWRGIGREADIREQTDIIEKYLCEMDATLNDNQIVLVNLHFLVNNAIDYNQFKHIKKFPNNYETYDLLSICDILVTDYSSVFFDFAVSGKKIIIFAYDEETYMKERGTYFPIDELPFPIVKNTKDLMKEINNEFFTDYKKFQDLYCSYARTKVAYRILDLIVNNNANDINMYENIQTNDIIHYVGNITSDKKKERIKNWINNSSDSGSKLHIVFTGRIDNKTGKFLRELPQNVTFIRLLRVNTLKASDLIKVRLNSKFDVCTKSTQKLYNKEFNRLLYNFRVKNIELLDDDGTFYAKMIKAVKENVIRKKKEDDN